LNDDRETTACGDANASRWKPFMTFLYQTYVVSEIIIIDILSYASVSHSSPQTSPGNSVKKSCVEYLHWVPNWSPSVSQSIGNQHFDWGQLYNSTGCIWRGCYTTLSYLYKYIVTLHKSLLGWIRWTSRQHFATADIKLVLTCQVLSKRHNLSGISSLCPQGSLLPKTIRTVFRMLVKLVLRVCVVGLLFLQDYSAIAEKVLKKHTILKRKWHFWVLVVILNRSFSS
jgi:hypothetical protein